MAIVYRFEMSNSAKEISSILVTDSMLRSYGITADQLHEDALEAAVQTHPATLRNMTDVMRDLMGDAAALFAPDEPSPMWVASVEGGQNGACAIQYPDFLEQAAETLGGDFYVLPSSIHEVLFVADDGSMDLSYLEEMVRSVNETYAEVLTAKKQAYAEYRQVKNEAQELLIAQRNIASLYDAERKEEEQKRLKENQIH